MTENRGPFGFPRLTDHGPFVEKEKTNNDNNKKMTKKRLEELKNRYSYKYSDIDALLEEDNDMMGGYGVESLQPEGAWVDSYYREIIALYVNLGDTYDSTLVYDTENKEYILTSWGNFYEGWMEEHPELSVD